MRLYRAGKDPSGHRVRLRNRSILLPRDYLASSLRTYPPPPLPMILANSFHSFRFRQRTPLLGVQSKRIFIIRFNVFLFLLQYGDRCERKTSVSREE